MAKANRGRSRKTPHHITTLIQIHRQLLAGSANLSASSPVFGQIFHIGYELEKGLRMSGVKTLADPRSGNALTRDLWPFGGGIGKPDQNEDDGLKDAVSTLGDARDCCEFLQRGDSRFFDSAAIGRFAGLCIEQAAKDLKTTLAKRGIKFDPENAVAS